MSIVNLPIIDSEDEIEFRKIFHDEYILNKHVFEDFALVIFPEDFEHICYEPAKGGEYKKKFSFRRARKLLAIRELCQGNIPYILIHQTERENRSVCVLASSAEFALYLIPCLSDQGNYFRLGTIISFGEEVEKRIEKQKKSGTIIAKIGEVF